MAARTMPIARYTSLVLLFLCLLALPAHVPGHAASGELEPRIRLVNLLVDVLDPLVLLIAVAAPFLAGGWRGVKAGARFLARGGSVDPAGSRSLAAAGRGLLWGSLGLNLVYVLSYYWPAGPGEAGLLGDFERLNYARYSSILAVTFGSFLLIPSAEAAAVLAGGRPSRVARVLDLLAPVGLLASALAVLLSVFVPRAPLPGEPDSAFVLPSARGLDPAFVAWSLVVVAVLATLALFATGRVGRPLAARLAATSLAAGVLVATFVELVGMNRLASRGGQGDTSELQELAGQMLVPFAVGLLAALCVGLGSVASTARVRVR